MYKPPSIPPIQNIADKPTKDALFALVEAHQVRNGQTGSGQDRFITKEEFDLALKSLGVAAPVQALESPGGTYGSGASSSGDSIDLLPLNNKWTGLNQWERPTPASTTADNWHIKLSRDGLARWLFQLGHSVSVPSTVGDLFITDAGRSASDAGGVSLTLKSMANGGALSFLDRTTANQVGKTAIQLRDTMKIGWDISGSINTLFNPYIGRWVMQASGVNRFAVNANTIAPDAIYINDDYLSNWQTVEAKYGSLHGIAWNTAQRYSVQKVIENIVTTSVDHGISIQNIRTLTGDGFTALPKNALMLKLDELSGGATAIANTYNNHALSWNTGTRYSSQLLFDNLAYQSVDFAANLNDIRNLSGLYNPSTSTNAFSQRLSKLYSDGTMNIANVQGVIPIERLPGVYALGANRSIGNAFYELETSLGNLWAIVNGMTKP